MTAKKGDGD
jgi:hypothetical protein